MILDDVLKASRFEVNYGKGELQALATESKIFFGSTRFPQPNRKSKRAKNMVDDD